MKKKFIEEAIRRLLCISISVLFVFGIFYVSPYTVSAEEKTNVSEEFEKNNVLDDLKGSTQNGKKFSLIDYNFDENKETQLFSFVEFCYSFYADKTEDYGLYAYVYNPKGLKIETESNLNAIILRYGDNQTISFIKYKLVFLNCSEGDYFGLFYKFKIVLSDNQKQEILRGNNAVNSSSRAYEVSEIELKVKNTINATAVKVGNKYKFSGYAKGYGADESASSSLKVLTEGSQESISLNVNPTYYRPSGTNGKNDYTQDSLHSVYFAVPNRYIAKYGEMYAVHATWLNALLKPMLVTGNQSAYAAISEYLGQDVSGVSYDALPYSYYGAYKWSNIEAGGINYYSIGYTYHDTNNLKHSEIMYGEKPCGYNISTLYGAFYSGSKADSVDSYIVSSNELYTELQKSATRYGGELVNGKFSKAIFERVEENFTEVNITRDENFPLSSQKLTQNWWQKILGIPNYTTMPTENISAIEKVTDDKINGDKESVCNGLYISLTDYDKFIDYYNTYTRSALNDYNEDCSVYLFRYMVSDYISQEASLVEYNKLWGCRDAKETNAYFFQETVNLDFDIIDLIFLKDDIYTVIPVIMSPIDIIHDVTPPVYTKSDNKKSLKTILLLLAMILLVVILMPVLPGLVQIIVIVVSLPFKLIAGLVKGIARATEKSRRKRADKSITADRAEAYIEYCKKCAGVQKAEKRGDRDCES